MLSSSLREKGVIVNYKNLRNATTTMITGYGIKSGYVINLNLLRKGGGEAGYIYILLLDISMNKRGRLESHLMI